MNVCTLFLIQNLKGKVQKETLLIEKHKALNGITRSLLLQVMVLPGIELLHSAQDRGGYGK